MTIKRNLTQLKARQQNTISNQPPARNEGSEGDIVARMTNKGPILYAKLQGQWHAFKSIGTSVNILPESTTAVATLVLKINEIIRRLV